MNNPQILSQVQAQVLRPSDIDQILSFEQRRLRVQIADEMEREMASWGASWRRESLEHYLPQGWCFGLWSDNQLCGYFLAQPQLFMRGHVQTLWVERLAADSAGLAQELVHIAYGMARDKHFQKVLFYQQEDTSIPLQNLKTNQLSANLFEVATSKIM